MHDAQIVGQCMRPVVQHGFRTDTLRDPERHVDVGPSILRAHNRRAGDGSCGRSIICARNGQDAFTDPVAFLVHVCDLPSCT